MTTCTCTHVHQCCLAKTKTNTNLVQSHISSTSTYMNFLSQFYFLTPWAIVHGLKGKLTIFEGKLKGAKSPKPEGPCPPNLVCMHVISTSTCINFLSQFYFLSPMDYSPWSEREIWPKMKRSEISETGEAMPTKLYVHAFHSSNYMDLKKKLYKYTFIYLFKFQVPLNIKGPSPLLSVSSDSSNDPLSRLIPILLSSDPNQMLEEVKSLFKQIPESEHVMIAKTVSSIIYIV